MEQKNLSLIKALEPYLEGDEHLALIAHLEAVKPPIDGVCTEQGKQPDAVPESIHFPVR